MSCDVCEVTEGLENEHCSFSKNLNIFLNGETSLIHFTGDFQRLKMTPWDSNLLLNITQLKLVKLEFDIKFDYVVYYPIKWSSKGLWQWCLICNINLLNWVHCLKHGCARVTHCVTARWRNFSHYCRPLRHYDVWFTCSDNREALQPRRQQTVYTNKRLEFATEGGGRLRFVTAVDGGLKRFPSVAWFAHPWSKVLFTQSFVSWIYSRLQVRVCR